MEGYILRGAMTTELELFRLFLTDEMIGACVTHTSSYALLKVGTRGYHKGYTDSLGSWNETFAVELMKYITLLIYFGLVTVAGDTAKYWSTKSIYHGLWARKILSRDRYQALSAFLHVADPVSETPGQKLRKVEEFLASFKERCNVLYQPEPLTNAW